VVRFEYAWLPGVEWEGVLAQELAAARGPAAAAVTRLPGGLLAVDYSRIDVRPRCLGPRA
jgi:hypothetical protein